MNPDVDTAFVTKSFAVGGGLIALSFVLQVAFNLLADQGMYPGNVLHVLWLSTANLLLWLGALASVPGLVALGVAAARRPQ